MIQQVAILGCGLIGSSWATFFASQGLRTLVYDIDPDVQRRGVETVGRQLDAMARHGLMTDDNVSLARTNVVPVTSLADLLERSDYVQESVLEDYDVKADVYRRMEPHLSVKAIIASSSSGLLMSRMQRALDHPERALIAHPFNPPHLIPLVELVPGDGTSDATVESIREFFVRLGKRPVVLKKEVPGHIANRLAAAVWREALALLDDDVASLSDIDAALCNGPGLRWALMGQHLIYDLGGGPGGYERFINTIGGSFSSYWRDMDAWSEIPESAKAKAIAGIAEPLQRRSRDEWIAWRDEKLMGLLRLLNADDAVDESEATA
ncbi:MAG: 3-hydroxyacyl-CoA dehydrogenase NAD-binding domain-containing protein [Pirellulaceae bacterium]